LPNLTTMTGVPLPPSACTTSSATRLVAPMTEVGRTALSVETRTNFSTWYLQASEATLKVPMTLLFTASTGASSIMGTCLYAAAW